MKAILIFTMLFLLPVSGGSQGKSRFSKIDIEGFDHADHVAVDKIEVLHDNETGNEIVCMESTKSAAHSYALSCFQSGRNWK